METNKVVAHLLDGRRFKGTTRDFFPGRAAFRVHPVSGDPPTEVAVSDLKALFFVRDLDGDKNYQRPRGFECRVPTPAQGKKIAVRFRDGELLCGYSLTYAANRSSFFLLPADGGGNNLRVYIVVPSAEEIRVGPAAEAMALQAIGQPTSAG